MAPGPIPLSGPDTTKERRPPGLIHPSPTFPATNKGGHLNFPRERVPTGRCPL